MLYDRVWCGNAKYGLPQGSGQDAPPRNDRMGKWNCNKIKRSFLLKQPYGITQPYYPPNVIASRRRGNPCLLSPTTLPNYVIARGQKKTGPRKATLLGETEEQRSEQGFPVEADAHIRPKGNDGFFPWFRMTKEIAKPSCPEGRMVFSLAVFIFQIGLPNTNFL